MSLTKDDLKVLTNPVEKSRLGVKVQSFNKERTQAMLVLYLQHTDVQDRLEQVDPAWGFTILHEERAGDTVYVRARMTVKGVSRENVGEGGDPKSAYSDCLKRCAMLFGVGRYLYDSDTVWTPYDDKRDRFKAWTVADYDAAAKKRGLDVARTAENTQADEPAREMASEQEDGVSRGAGGHTRESLNKRLMELYKPFLTKFPGTDFKVMLEGRYGAPETRLLAIEQLEDFVSVMEVSLKTGQLPPKPAENPLCANCRAPMIETSKRDALRCSKWKSGTKEKHAYVAKVDLQAYLADQAVTKGWTASPMEQGN